MEINDFVQENLDKAGEVFNDLKNGIGDTITQNLGDKIPAQYIGIISIAVIGVFALMVFGLFMKPIKWGLKLLINGISGFVGLWLINYFGAQYGLNIEINLISAVLVGALGLPGVLVLVLQQYFM